MHTRRNSPSVVNGDTGFIEKVSTEKDIIKVSVRINGKLLTYEKDDLHCLEHAYAMSIHKSQGSEYKAVVTAILLEHGPMLYRNIPYVAISRGKTVVDLVRDRGYFDAIRKTLTEKRITRLAFFLKEMQ